MDYVECKKILECFTSNDKCYEILFHSLGTTPDRIVFSNDILDDYSLLECEGIRSWLSLVTMNKNSYRKIACKTDHCSNVYVNVCLNTSDKLLIADEKEDYDDEDIDNLDILNKQEAHSNLQNNSTIYIRGNNASVTTGPNSNILKSEEAK